MSSAKLSPAASLPTDPFNHYNTEFVKLDANNMAMEDETGELRSFSELSLAPANFALLTPDDQLIDGSPLVTPPDSINNKSFTDVTFIVGPSQHSKKYVGHRVLLAMTSPVFETMFYGDMADKNKYIRIADVAPIGFENLLRYAYTDSLNLNSVEDAMLTAYAAKKYLLPQLLRECLTYIELNISPASACVVFEFAHVLNSQQLVLQAMNLIDRQTGSVVLAKSFSHVQATTVEFVANRKYLNLNSEFVLFEALLNWSLAEAKRRQLPTNDWLAIRAIMSEISILSAIRFLAMSPEEFARAVSQSSGRLESPSINSRASIAATNGDEVNSKMAEGDSTAMEQETGARQAVELDDSNSLLTVKEQRTVLLNLALPNLAQVPKTLSKAILPRQPPPDYFTLKRFRSSGNLATTTTTTRSIKCISATFQCLSENVFIVALTIPIKLDAGSYANRTPKFECHLKFTTRTTSNASPVPNYLDGNDATAGGCVGSNTATGGGSTNADSAAVLMDTIDESLHISIARDKDCLVKLKRPILIRMGNINELTLTFQTYALDEDIVALQTPKLRAANFSEQTDDENISWLFFKTANVEFSELHYYY